MELFEARDHFIIQDGEHGLWCNRFDGSLTARQGSDICTAWNPICLGRVYGVIGKVRIHPESEWKLILVKQRSLVGKLPCGADIYKINKISVLPLCLAEVQELDIELCMKHHFGIRKPEKITQTDVQQKSLQKTWNQIKSAAENVKPKKREIKEKEKYERRILEELLKMFNDSDSFYFCPNADITSSIQRQHTTNSDSSAPLWQKADLRFFWNHYMLQDLTNSKDPLADHWIVPVIQGYVQVETCSFTYDDEWPNMEKDREKPLDSINFNITIISRRSRFRAGTRYKRRGVDEDGECANYVETEQIIELPPHVVSFVQVRGSIPVFWSQTGYKYRPPPRIDKGVKENEAAFQKHFVSQLHRYESAAIISLVDQVGKEKIMADTFLEHIIKFNSPDLTYIAFDFHEYCRGMRFENVSVLTDNIKDIIKDMRYCWVDDKGMICDQKGVFRINCVDCLDRTNVVQSAIARIVMETQCHDLGILAPDQTLSPPPGIQNESWYIEWCRKLGLLPPEEHLSSQSKIVYQQLWANNGDVISRQYAGTAALKGDYTRTGERKFSGMMKDGMNSANRYYLNRFKDAYRQAAIDLMQGNAVTEDFSALATSRADDDDVILKEENMKTLIDECKKMLISETEDCLGGWGLIDCDPVTGDPTQQDMDVILLLTQHAYYVASYDDDIDEVIHYQRVPLEDLQRIEIGPSPSIFKSKYVNIRLFYTHEGESGYFHTFRTTGTRLFNNMLIAIKNQEEAKESLRVIYESFAAAQNLIDKDLMIVEMSKLDRKKSKPPPDVVDIKSEAHLKTWTKTSLSPDPSTSDLKPASSSRPSSGRRIGAITDNLQRTLAGINRKVGLNRLRPSMLAFYTKDNNSRGSSHTGSDISLEHAQIIQGEVSSGRRTRKSNPSDVTDGGFVNSAAVGSDGVEEASQHALLQSCGIVVADSPRHSARNSALFQNQRSFSDDALNLLDEDSHLSGQGQRSLPLLHMMTSPCEYEDKEEVKRTVEGQDQEIKLIVQEAHHDNHTTQETPSASILNQSTEDMIQFTDVHIQEQTSSSNIDPTTNKITAEKSNSDMPPMFMLGGDFLNEKGATNTSGEIIKPKVVNLLTPQATTSRNPLLSEIGPPHMKTSLSDGAISYHMDGQENIDIGMEDKVDGATSTFSKLRTKINITLPTIPSPQTRRKKVHDNALEKRIKSEMQYYECKTKIILL